MFKITDLHDSADRRHSGTPGSTPRGSTPRGTPIAWGGNAVGDDSISSGAKQPIASKGKDYGTSISSMRKELAMLDKNGDGTVSADEIIDIVEAHAKAQTDLKQMKMMALALLFVVLLTVGATVGLTYTLLIKTKETSVSSSGTMMQIGTNVPVATRQTYYFSSYNMYNMAISDLFETSGLTFENFLGADIAVRIDAGVRFTINTTDPTTGANIAPHVLLKTRLGDILAFADGTYNGPAFDGIANLIPGATANGRRLLQTNQQGQVAGGPGKPRRF